MIRSLPFLVLIVFCGWFTGYTQIKLPRLISDGAILQRDMPCNVWGWASAGEKIELELQGKKYTTHADSLGNWKIVLPPQPVGDPVEIKLTGKNEITLKNILFGDVWVCSGQSNMELTMRRLKDKYNAVIAASENNSIRQFEVPDRYDFNTRHNDVELGKWVTVNPTTVLDFSAVAYFFANDLYSRFKVPVGLINAALGGSPVEAWISESSLQSFPDVLDELQPFKNDSIVAAIEKRNAKIFSDWFAKLHEQDQIKHHGKELTIDESEWNEITLPGYWTKEGALPVNGSVWVRKRIVVPESMLGKRGKIWLGRIVDADSVFINGKFVGSTSYQYPPRKYEFDESLLKAGENMIAVKVISQAGRGGFVPDKPYFLSAGTDTLSLVGSWKYKVAATMKSIPPTTTIRFKPTGLHNNMIAPLYKYTIKGVIWYQGESNTGRPASYSALFSTLIKSWRTEWNQGEFPFLFVQLANFMETKADPSESTWAELRQAQLETLHIPNTAMAVTIDVGEWNDIHPLNKEAVGQRLSLAAQHLAYHQKDIVYSGPQYLNYKTKGNKVIIRFNSMGGGLVAKGNTPLRYFSVAGADKKFVWASAVIKGNKVIVMSDTISKPVFVRYAWADNPEGANLYNKEGLPASPFQFRIE